MNRSHEEIQKILAGFRAPDRSAYPELEVYSRAELYQNFYGGGGLYLAVRMMRTLRLQPGQVVLDLGCGQGDTCIYLAKNYGVQVRALDLWTSSDYLEKKFAARGCASQISAVQMDAAAPLPYAENEFDAIFCMNSFNFYGGEPGFLERLLKHLKPGGQLCIGSEGLTAEFTPDQLANPPAVYAFRLPPPNEHIDVFRDDFSKQHTLFWWRDLLQSSGLVEVETCYELEDADRLYEELVWFEHTFNMDPFDVQICLDQIDWGRTRQPRKALYVLTVRKL